MVSAPPTTRPEFNKNETAVALKLATDMTIEAIADSLGFNFEQTRKIVDRIREKTALRRRAQLAVWSAANQSRLLQDLKRPRTSRSPRSRTNNE